MDSKKCKKCIHSKDADIHTNSVCEICFNIDSKGNGENTEFIERIEPVGGCGGCVYCKDTLRNNNHYCEASAEFDKDDRRIKRLYIRKNYLTKGTPKWCPLK